LADVRFSRAAAGRFDKLDPQRRGRLRQTLVQLERIELWPGLGAAMTRMDMAAYEVVEGVALVYAVLPRRDARHLVLGEEIVRDQLSRKWRRWAHQGVRDLGR
jgi:hypothetical protein